MCVVCLLGCPLRMYIAVRALRFLTGLAHSKGDISAALYCSIVQYSADQYSAGWYNTVQNKAVQ